MEIIILIGCVLAVTIFIGAYLITKPTPWELMTEEGLIEILKSYHDEHGEFNYEGCALRIIKKYSK